MPLPLILAGPILRRAEPDRVLVWVATSEAIDLGGEVYPVNTSIRPPMVQRGLPIGRGVALRRVRLGARLYIHLIALVPVTAGGTFPARTMLAYDLQRLNGPGSAMSGSGAWLRDLMDIRQVCLAPFPTPTFVLQDMRRAEMVGLYGSCRKLHGHGNDAMSAAVRRVERSALDVRERPTALLLGGDQSYADDVSDVLIQAIARLGEELQGAPEPMPDIPGRVSGVGVGGRQAIVSNSAWFTSGEAGNHLITFGEFAAAYLLAWNPEIWPESLPPSHAVYLAQDPANRKSGRMVSQMRKFDEQRESLRNARRGSGDIRKVMANTPTYMIFDDHEVTDDWNLNDSWQSAVRSRPLGRRIISNGLAAFWAFQSWGNDPSVFNRTFIDGIEQRLGALEGDGSGYERMLLDFGQWSFTTATQPRALMLDSRTGRDRPRANYDLRHGSSFFGPSPLPVPVPRPPAPRSLADVLPGAKGKPMVGQPAHLIGANARARLQQLSATMARRAPVLMLAPAPVFGLEILEGLQDALSRVLGSSALDLEHWHANPESMLDLMDLAAGLRPDPLVILSGDVHYAFEVVGEVVAKSTAMRVAQFTSSATKNASPGALQIIGLMQALSQAISSPFIRSRREFWRVGGGVNHILDVTGVAGAVLAASMQALRGRNPDVVESMEFKHVVPGISPSVVLSPNNIGEIRISGSRVGHRLHFITDSGSIQVTPLTRV